MKIQHLNFSALREKLLIMNTRNKNTFWTNFSYLCAKRVRLYFMRQTQLFINTDKKKRHIIQVTKPL